MEMCAELEAMEEAQLSLQAQFFCRLRHSRTALWCCASSHQATGVQASRPCRAPIADASGRPGLRAALACFAQAFVVGLAC